MRGSIERRPQRAWVRAIGEGLRAEYAATDEPVPERLAALLHRIDVQTDDAVVASEVHRSRRSPDWLIARSERTRPVFVGPSVLLRVAGSVMQRRSSITGQASGFWLQAPVLQPTHQRSGQHERVPTAQRHLFRNAARLASVGSTCGTLSSIGPSRRNVSGSQRKRRTSAIALF
jgi:hypothetical protein